MPHRLRLVILLGVLAVTFGLLAWSFLANTSPEEQAKPLARNQDDSRRSYPGPFLNIHPDVKYVGMEACGECHAGIADTYSRHGMARSLRPVKELARTQVYDGSHNNPFRAFGSLFRVDRDEGRVWHREIRLDEKEQQRDCSFLSRGLPWARAVQRRRAEL